jgi:hypothetical protein
MSCRPFFVHFDTLFNTLMTGGTEFGDVDEQGSQRWLLVDYLPHFGTPSEAILHALKYPPKAEFYGKCARTETFHSYPAIDPSDANGWHTAWIMEFPSVGGLDGLLKSCSFSDMIVEKQTPPPGIRTARSRPATAQAD